jgi:hypothetical protein
VVRLELDRRLEGADGAARIAQIEQRCAEARLRLQRLWVARHGTTEMRGRVFQFSLPSQLRREVVVGVGELGVELHGALERRLCIVQASLAQKDVAEIVVRGGEFRIDGDGFGDERPRVVEPPCLERDDAEQVLRIEVSRSCREDLPVQRAASFRRPGLLMGDGCLQQCRRTITGRGGPA